MTDREKLEIKLKFLKRQKTRLENSNNSQKEIHLETIFKLINEVENELEKLEEDDYVNQDLAYDSYREQQMR